MRTPRPGAQVEVTIACMMYHEHGTALACLPHARRCTCIATTDLSLGQRRRRRPDASTRCVICADQRLYLLLSRLLVLAVVALRR